MIRGFLYIFYILTAGMVLSSCVTNPPLDRQGCENADWYELGRRDGAQGLPVNVYESRRQDCGLKSEIARENLYLNGRNAGLVDFCTSDNGFEMGRTGQIYYYVCPVDEEVEFLSRYRVGRKVYQLEKANQEISSELETLLARLRSAQISAQQKGALGKQVENLKSARVQNDKALQELKRSL
ncbi:MAG: DUF2799 domain-containing protein [Bdellovibrionaceae bacterium]|nr:DUF2799 domain-containing protein [Bdellovibrionales bacterium]MCB9085583.1 DUF2799 domain-containing protein [Pseudobdellovibrionaceae bacterium]